MTIYVYDIMHVLQEGVQEVKELVRDAADHLPDGHRYKHGHVYLVTLYLISRREQENTVLVNIRHFAKL